MAIKRECRYVNGKLKTWEERLKINFHGQDVLYDMYCSATAVLKIDSSTKKAKIIILRYMLKSVNTPTQKNNSVACWVMMMMDFPRCKKKA